jgi:hypothetical protein
MVRKKKGFKRFKPDKSGKPGPKSEFTPGTLRKVTLLAKLGATNQVLAEYFEKDISTIDNWIQNNKEFRAARKKGGLTADMKVVASFFQRAVGYDFIEEQVVNHKGVPVVIKVKKHVVPDVKACHIWMVNRQKAHWANNTTQNVNVKGNVNHNHNNIQEVPIQDLSKDARKLLFEITNKQLAVNATSDN